MILATASGWLISGTVARETKKHYVFMPSDGTRYRMIKKSSAKERLFDDAFIASDWVDNMNKRGL